MSYKDDLALKISTYSGEQMVALAYDAVMENMEQAVWALSNSQMDIVDKMTDHNREILAHLTASLGEQEDEASLTTKQLYLYINRLMTEAVIKKNPHHFMEASKILMPLRDGWRELSIKLEELENSSGSPVHPAKNVYAGMTYGKTDINIHADSKDWDKA